jgi:hypothetical protein
VAVERQIEAEVEVRAMPGRVAQLLVDAPETVIGPATSGGRGACVGEIPLRLHGGSSVRQDVEVTVALTSTTTDEGFAFELDWRPTGRGRLLPTFAGVLEGWESPGGTTLRLSGAYHPPLGYAGALGDAVVGKRVAQGGLEAFLATLAERIDAEIDRRLASGAIRPASAVIDLRETEFAENWLG